MAHKDKTFRDELPSAIWYTVFMVGSWLLVQARGGFSSDWLLLAAPFVAFGSSWWRTRHSRRPARDTGAARIATVR